LECGSKLPPLFAWSCSGSVKAQASVRTPNQTSQHCWKNPCQLERIFRLSSQERVASMGEALEAMRQGVTLKVTLNPALKGATFAGPSLAN